MNEKIKEKFKEIKEHIKEKIKNFGGKVDEYADYAEDVNDKRLHHIFLGIIIVIFSIFFGIYVLVQALLPPVPPPPQHKEINSDYAALSKGGPKSAPDHFTLAAGEYNIYGVDKNNKDLTVFVGNIHGGVLFAVTPPNNVKIPDNDINQYGLEITKDGTWNILPISKEVDKK